MAGKFTVAFHTLGCKVNQYETEAIKELYLKKDAGAMFGIRVGAGVADSVGDETGGADVFVINTCTVTNLSDRKSRQMIRRAIKQNPDAVIVVTGCYSQTAPEEVAGIEGVDLIIGTSERSKIVEQTLELLKHRHTTSRVHASVNVNEIAFENTFEPLSIDDCEDNMRVFVKIQDGCENYCAYCKIPFARGPVRSRPFEDIVNEVKRLVKAGFIEVVLTGIHLASYGKDFANGEGGGEDKEVDLVDVIQALAGDDAGLAKLARIRLGSVEPTTLTARFVEAVASLPKCCPHFHVSLQSGCDSTLGRMNRKYSTLEYSNAVARLRAKVKDVALTTDIIVGFPGETDSDFEESLEFVRQIGFAAVHVFPFSPRKGTVAAKMSDQIAPEIKARRSERMIALATELSRTFHEHMLGREWDVLIEEKDADGRYIGHTGNFTKCACVRAQEICGAPQTLAAGISHGEGVIGEIVRVKAVGIEGDKIVGNLVEDDES